MAPAAVPSPTERATGTAAGSGAELLVLVDETGAGRRGLIARDVRVPRRRELERLGFRVLSRAAVANGAVNESTRELLALGEAEGLPITYLRAASGWTTAMQAHVEAAVVSARPLRANVSREADQATSLEGQIKAIESALLTAEDNVNLALAAACGSPEGNLRDEWPESTRRIRQVSGGDCRAEARTLLNESAEFIVAAGAMIAALEACSVSLGAACILVPPTYVVYHREGMEMYNASLALRNCLGT